MSKGSLLRVAQPSHALLKRILERPELARAVESLDGTSFTRLVRHIGLEDAGEVLALATREQLELFLDEELWRSARPGDEERFDPERFALWLEVLLEGGDAHAAARLAELSEELLWLGFSAHLLVIDVDALAVSMASEASDENEWLEKALESSLYHEFEGFRVIARRASGWDALIGALLALDRDHHELVERLLERLCHASTEFIENNGGLYEVLSSEEMLESDAAQVRDDRRAAAGYVAPSSAKAFLRLAETTKLESLISSRERDPITRAYFRELDRNPRERSARVAGSEELACLLEEAGIVEAPRAPRLTGTEQAVLLITQALSSIKSESRVYAERMEELAYLSNCLCAFAERDEALRPSRAIERAIEVVNLGLEYVLGEELSLSRALDAVRERSLDQLFRIGWHLERKRLEAPRRRRT